MWSVRLVLIFLLSLTVSQLSFSQEDLDSLISKGALELKQGNYQDAIFYFDKVLEIDPNNVKALLNKGISLGNQGLLDDALYHFSLALELEPDNVSTLNNIAVIYEQKQDYSKALSYLEKTLQIEPNNEFAINKKKSIETIQEMRFLMDKGISLAIDERRYREALSYFDKVLEIDPNNVQALTNKGAALVKLGLTQKSIDYFEKAMEINPYDNLVLTNLAAIFINHGELSKADYYLEKAIENNPEDSFARYLKKTIENIGLLDLPTDFNISMMAIYFQSSIWDSSGHLSSYIESDDLFVYDINKLSEFLNGTDYDFVPPNKEGTFSVRYNHIIRNDQEIELVQIHHFAVYVGQDNVFSQTRFIPDGENPLILANHHGYVIERGDSFYQIWNILRPVS